MGIDAQMPNEGPAAAEAAQLIDRFADEQDKVAPRIAPSHGRWQPGDAPSLALRWAVQAVAKAGTLGIIGVYPPQHEAFPIGAAMNANLTVKMGNCNHRKHVPGLLSEIAAGYTDPHRGVDATGDKPYRASGIRGLRPPRSRMDEGHPRSRLTPSTRRRGAARPGRYADRARCYFR